MLLLLQKLRRVVSATKPGLATEISGMAAVQTSTLMGERSGDFPCGRSPKHPLGPGRQKRRLR